MNAKDDPTISFSHSILVADLRVLAGRVGWRGLKNDHNIRLAHSG